jgi:three-Cys-motif partner protein
MSQKFFDEQQDQSLVKATIVSKYFARWAQIMIATQKRNEQEYGRAEGRIAYLDLFAGPGRYKAGSQSTPLLVLEEAIKDDNICKRLVTIFNDKDSDNVRSLETEINQFPNLGRLRYKPQVINEEVGTEMVALFESLNLVPTLFFVDPFGYKGLSLRLINSVLKNWGCDCIFFFNYNRINMGLSNEKVKEHMDALFGEARGTELRKELEQLAVAEREYAIVEALAQALKEYGGEYALPFRFKDANGTRTSHHLIFVCKDFKGYEVMKEIMAKESSAQNQGVPSFEYNPATKRQPLLFQLARPLDELGDMLLEEFQGQSLKMLDIYMQHNVGTPFIKSNYKQILRQLEDEGKITADKHRKGTFGDDVTAHFPS